MSKEEIEVVKQIKKKQAMDKHRMLKKQNMSKPRNNSEISEIPENEKASNSENEFEIADSELTDNSQIHSDDDESMDESKRFTTAVKHDGVICEKEFSNNNEIANDSKSETASHDKHRNEIMSGQPMKNSEIRGTPNSEAEIEREPQVFQMYDDEDESDNEVYEALSEESDEVLEEYHQKMNETTFKQFNKLYDKLLKLVKNNNFDEDEFEMLQSQLKNMMEEADENDPLDEALQTFIEETMHDIESYKRKDDILEQIEELKALTKTTEEIEAMEKWMPVFEEILRLKRIRLQSNRKSKKHKKKSKR
jgi:hypothetical protein